MLTVGYLSYLTHSNYERKINVYKKSIESLKLLENQNCTLLIINNGDSILLKNVLNEYNIKKCLVLNLNENFYDIAVHFFTYLYSLKIKNDYMLYLYDDFVLYDNDFINDSIEFMNIYKQCNCMRIPKYETGNNYYNTKYTSKSINPDSVRHETGVNNTKLITHGPYNTGSHSFYISNWRPNSRPTIWRCESFKYIFDTINNNSLDIPIMQGFEKFMYDCSDIIIPNYCSSYLENGACYTFNNISDRLNELSYSIEYTKKVSLKKLLLEFNKQMEINV